MKLSFFSLFTSLTPKFFLGIGAGLIFSNINLSLFTRFLFTPALKDSVVSNSTPEAAPDLADTISSSSDQSTPRQTYSHVVTEPDVVEVDFVNKEIQTNLHMLDAPELYLAKEIDVGTQTAPVIIMQPTVPLPMKISETGEIYTPSIELSAYDSSTPAAHFPHEVVAHAAVQTDDTVHISLGVNTDEPARRLDTSVATDEPARRFDAAVGSEVQYHDAIIGPDTDILLYVPAMAPPAPILPLDLLFTEEDSLTNLEEITGQADLIDLLIEQDSVLDLAVAATSLF